MPRLLLFLALHAAAATLASAQLPAAYTKWLSRISPLRSGTARSFQFETRIDAGPERLIAYVSWAPPNHRCMILCDRVDSLPLLVAVDGQTWLYDIIGGQIVLIRAEPEFLMKVYGGDAQCSWGIRADFPDAESHTTLNVDFPGLMTSLLLQQPKRFSLDAAGHTATCRGEGVEAVLQVTGTDTLRPAMFSFSSGTPERRFHQVYGAFAFDAPVPPWHHPVDRDSLEERVPVVAVAQAESLGPDAKERLHTLWKVFTKGGLFLMRAALRDTVLRRKIELHTPDPVDFDAMGANDARLSGRWRAALRAQGFELPVREPAVVPEGRKEH